MREDERISVSPEEALELMKSRRSIRRYTDEPVPEALLEEVLEAGRWAPSASNRQPWHFIVVRDVEMRQAVAEHAAYYFIKWAHVEEAPVLIALCGETRNRVYRQFLHEDVGLAGGQMMLQATALGLGTCWLGGSFTKSRFARAIDAGPDESVPAVVAAGYPAQSPGFLDRRMRHPVQADHRFPWNRLFWNGQFGTPLTVEAAGAYASVVENVRRGPSASNKQPWRVVRCGDRWHLYIQRTPGYRDGIFQRLGGIADMQRIDLGIALCHWELSAGERNLEGHWQRSDPGLALPDEHTEYGITWVAGA